MAKFDIYFITIAILSLMYMLLSFNVIRHRRSKQVLYGANKNIELKAAIRAHANFIEYVPIILFLFAGLIYFRINGYVFDFLCILLVLARISHSIGLLKYERLNPPFLKPRFYGMVGTFSIILISAIYILKSFVVKLIS